MPRYKYLKNNFSSGIFSAITSRRSDLDRYKNGAKDIRNMIVLPQGGLAAREGSLFVAETKDSSKESILIPFQYSTSDTYALEFGDRYMRVYKESGLVLEADKTITDITSASPAVVTSAGHGFSNGDQIYITEVGGMDELNSNTLYYTVAGVTANTFELKDRDGNNVSTLSFGSYTGGGVANRIYTVTTPYLEADLRYLQFTQSADVLTITHQNYSPRDISRTSDTSWTVTPLMKDSSSPSATLLIEDGPYLTENSTATTFTPSGTSGTVTITASSITGINKDTGFQTTDVGRLFRIKDAAGNWTWGEITVRNSTTSIDVVIKGPALSSTAARTTWRLGAWSRTTGFPRSVSYFQLRKMYASTVEQPDTVWGSEVDDFPSFVPTNATGVVADSNAVTYTLGSNRVNAIYWLVGGSDRLRMGTEGGIWTISSGSSGNAITPTSVRATQENPTRCKELQPTDLGNTTIFVQRSGKIMRELYYSFDVDALIAPDITIVAEDILGKIGLIEDEGAISTAFQQEPIPIIWVAKANGELVGCTYAKDQDIIAWHPHTLSGSVTSVICVPMTGQDIVWIIVKRTINGSTRRFVEKLDVRFRDRNVRDGVFVDSALKLLGEMPNAILTPGAVSGSGVLFTTDNPSFDSGDVGRIIDVRGYRAVITGYTNNTTVTCTILDTFPNTNTAGYTEWVMSVNQIDGLDHLNGETVQINANGGRHSDQVVTNGVINLDGQYTHIVVGLGYDKSFELLPVDFGSQTGTAFGGKSAVSDVYIDFFETSSGKIGFSDVTLTEIVFRDGTDPIGKGVAPKTGVKKLQPKGGWEDNTTLKFVNDGPLPSTILSKTLEVQLND